MTAVLLTLLVAALVSIQTLIGGARLLFALPAYGLIAVAAALTLFRRPSPTARPERLCLLGTLLFGGCVLTRALLSPVPYLAWPDYFEMLACLAVYGLVLFYLTEKRFLGWLFGALLIVASAQVLVGIRQFAGGDEFMPFGFLRGAIGRRASGFYINPNHFAGVLEAPCLLAFSFAGWSTQRWWARVLALYAGLACLVGIVLSGSRGGYLSIAAGVLVLAVLSVAVTAALDRQRANWLGLGAIIVFCGAILVFLAAFNQSMLLQARVQTLTHQLEQGQMDWRIYNWQAALAQSGISPLVGTGSGSHLYLGRFFRVGKTQFDPVHAHCDYLEILAEYGWLGAAALLFFLGTHFWAGFRHLSQIVRHEILPAGYLRNDEVAISIGVLSAGLAMAVHSTVDFNLHIPGTALLFAVVFALLARRPETPSLPSAAKGFSPVRLALPLVGLLLGIGGLPKLPGEYWAEQIRRKLVAGHDAEAVALGARVKLNPGNPEAFFNLGEANRVLASQMPRQMFGVPYLKAALADFQRALSIFPQDEVTWVRMGQALDGLGRWSDAETAYQTALALDPNSGLVHVYHAAHLQKVGHSSEADEELATSQKLLWGTIAPELVKEALASPFPELKKGRLQTP